MMPQRSEIILRHADRNGLGLEIGPSYRPVAPKRNGFHVHIIDHLDRESLVAKYRTSGVPVADIEEVDFVWNGEPYAKLTGRPGGYDWIISSHLAEHVPDFIGFLLECDSILKPAGVLSLAVPDARFCFDHYRPLTGLARIIDAHEQRRTRHSVGTAAEYHLNVCSRKGLRSWLPSSTAPFEFCHTHSETRDAMAACAAPGGYMDMHAWCFTPASFRLLIHDLNLLGFVPFLEVDFQDCGTDEFFMTVGRNGHGPGLSRQAMLEAIQDELAFRPDTRSKLRRSLSKRWASLKRLAGFR